MLLKLGLVRLWFWLCLSAMASMQVAVVSVHRATDGACKGCVWRERWQKASMTAASGFSADGSIGFQMWLLQKNIMNTAVAEIT